MFHALLLWSIWNEGVLPPAVTGVSAVRKALDDCLGVVAENIRFV